MPDLWQPTTRAIIARMKNRETQGKQILLGLYRDILELGTQPEITELEHLHSAVYEALPQHTPGYRSALVTTAQHLIAHVTDKAFLATKSGHYRVFYCAARVVKAKKLEPLEALEYFGALNADHAQLAHDALVSGSMRDAFFGSGVLDPASRVTVAPGANLYVSPSLPQQTTMPEPSETRGSEPPQTQNASEPAQPSSVTFAPTGNADLACIQIYDRGFSRFTHVNHLSHDQALELLVIDPNNPSNQHEIIRRTTARAEA